jgi:hypothetical protein
VHEGPWEQLAGDLTAELPRLRDADTVILRHGERLVQFQQFPTVLHAEAASNEFLPPDQALTPDAEQKLRRLGWNEPTPPGYCNWWYETPWPLTSTASKAIAQLLLATLREVYGVPGPRQLTYQAFNTDTAEPLTLGALADLTRAG